MAPTAGRPHAFPVSVKGVVVRAGRVLLLRNERDEWELPGGKLEPGEDPPACLAREVAEETGLSVATGPILDAWVYHVAGHDVLVVTYGCSLRDAAPDTSDDASQDGPDRPRGTPVGTGPVVSEEHAELGLFTKSEVAGLAMPDGYRRSIATWFAWLRNAVDGVVDGIDMVDGTE